MQAFDDSGNHRPATGEEIHRFDQMHSTFRDLTAQLVGLQYSTKQIVAAGEESQHAEMSRVHNEIKQIMSGLVDKGPSMASSYIMYLISIICDYEIGQENQERLADVIFKAMSLLVGPDHPHYGLGIDPAEIARRINDTFPAPPQRESYTTGTGQQLHNVHPAQECDGFCVIHRPCPGPWAEWPTNWRGDNAFDVWRGFERICPCGVGHPAVEELLRNERHVPHGCCGVCRCGPADCEPDLDDSGNLKGFV